MASTYLSKTLSNNNNSNHKFTISTWFKKLKIMSQQSPGSDEFYIVGFNVDNSNRAHLRINSDDTLSWLDRYGGTTIVNKQTTAKLRDTNAWYHVVVSVDKSVSTPDTKIYINGVENTSWVTNTDYSQNATSKVNDAVPVYINSYDTSLYFSDSIFSHTHFIDGTAYDASTFGESDANGVWTPKTSPSVTYGTNGFFLKFESGSMGTDSSGNGNNFTVNGTLTQTLDTPSNVYATLNPLMPYPSGMTFSNGNTTLTCSTTQWQGSVTTLAPSKGKWYFEAKYNTGTGIKLDIGRTGGDFLNMATVNDSYLAYSSTGYGYQLNNSGADYYVAAGTAGTWNASRGNSTKIIMVAVDLDNGKLWYGDSGTWYNTSGTANPVTGTDPRHSFSADLNDDFWFFGMSIEGTASSHNLNFGNGYFGTTAVSSGNADGNGQGIFEYAPPSGFYALNTKNLATYG